MAVVHDPKYLSGAREKPEWAKFRARDSDGLVYWYENRPTKTGVDWQVYDGYIALAYSNHWEDSLEEYLD
jgi:hypothetical protein